MKPPTLVQQIKAMRGQPMCRQCGVDLDAVKGGWKCPEHGWGHHWQKPGCLSSGCAIEPNRGMSVGMCSCFDRMQFRDRAIVTQRLHFLRRLLEGDEEAMEALAKHLADE